MKIRPHEVVAIEEFSRLREERHASEGLAQAQDLGVGRFAGLPGQARNERDAAASMVSAFAATFVTVPNSDISAATASDSGVAIGKAYFAVFAAVFRARAMFVSMSQACFRFAGPARPVPGSGDPRKIVLPGGAG